MKISGTERARRASCLLATIFAAALLAGCSQPQPERPLPPTTAPTVEPGTLLTPEAPSDDALSRLLLTEEELPQGWRGAEKGDPARVYRESTFFCKEFPVLATGSAESSFTRSENGPYLTVEVALLPNNTARGAMLLRFEAAGDCYPGWSGRMEDGTPVEWELAPLAFPNIADRTHAFRLTTPADAADPRYLELIVIQQGDYIISLSHSGRSEQEVDSDETRVLARLAVDKLERTLGASGPLTSVSGQ